LGLLVGAQELKMMTKGITAQNRENEKKVVLMIATTRLFIQKQKCHIGPNKVNLVSKNKGTNSTN
jgi:hypothetical protein